MEGKKNGCENNKNLQINDGCIDNSNEFRDYVLQ